MSTERQRLRDPLWKKWGPYLSERQWGTVREDYSPDGAAWESISHDGSRSRAYRWGEDGIGGFCDEKQRICFSVALWNERDPYLKERIFGLTGNQGNHGEDVKDYYAYLDSTPTHSYMKMLYKYPQAEFPYQKLVDENKRRGKGQPEFELFDTGVFKEGRYFDVFIEYAKQTAEDTVIRITVSNRGPDTASIHVVPQICFRNTWAWDITRPKPFMAKGAGDLIEIFHRKVGSYTLHYQAGGEALFCENETNHRRLHGVPDPKGYTKDGLHEYIVNGRQESVNPAQFGTKAGVRYRLTLAGGETREVLVRLSSGAHSSPFASASDIVAARKGDADEFYAALQSEISDPDARLVQRQSLAGMLWSKQFYYYDISQWLYGDPSQPQPPEKRRTGRNSNWLHMRCADIISMPDKWEYPWFAAWDLAFHCIPLVLVDPEFAKEQLLLLTRDWYMHPNGQLPAYEWQFNDVNPPVHAWAAWRCYKIEKKQNGGIGDIDFLESIFLKLLLNFTWWVNQKDEKGQNIFQGGFLGLDNIGVFDRNASLPTGGHIEQADATAWMAMYSLNMMVIALELSTVRPTYQDLASKFFEHFLFIANAMMNMGGEGIRLWNEQDGFYYDVLHLPDGRLIPFTIRSLVGLIPLFAVETIEPDLLEKVPVFKARMEWFLENRPHLAALVSRWYEPGRGERRLLSLLRGHRMKRLLRRLLDPSEFLSDYGIRALSKFHKDNPYEFRVGETVFKVDYQPAESNTTYFGGNSNWRGPIWMPTNFLIVEALQKFYHYYGDDFKIECPTGSGNQTTINEAANEISRRLCSIFLRDANGRRAVFGNDEMLQTDEHFRDHVMFYEYFHGDNGSGVGASHQTGWSGLVAKLLLPRSRRKGVASTEGRSPNPHIVGGVP